MEINELVQKAHENAVNKGFWEMEQGIMKKLNYGEKLGLTEILAVANAFTSQRLMLIVSEASEALEALRKGDYENFDEEVSDMFIRLGDFCGGEDINIEAEISKKMEKNKERPRLHGKAF